MMAQMLHHGCLANFEIANTQFQFTHIILDRTNIRANGAQMFKNEIFDVVHAFQFTPAIAKRRRSALRWPHGMGACCNLPCPARVQLASHRNPSTVSRDVSKLSEPGLVKVESVSNEGHGQKKTVLPVANTISISAAIAAA